MAIVSFEYYTSTYLGEPVDEADFPRYDLRAEMVIRNITKGATDRFDSMTEATQDAVKNAICAQIEFFSIYGIEVAVGGRTGGGFTVGKVSVQNGSEVKTGASSTVCPLALEFLEQTGLLNPAVETVDKPFWWWGY
jgi:hypothetical protein